MMKLHGLKSLRRSFAKALIPLTPLAWALGFAWGLWQRRRSLWRNYAAEIIAGAVVCVYLGGVVRIAWPTITPLFRPSSRQGAFAPMTSGCLSDQKLMKYPDGTFGCEAPQRAGGIHWRTTPTACVDNGNGGLSCTSSTKAMSDSGIIASPVCTTGTVCTGNVAQMNGN